MPVPIMPQNTDSLFRREREMQMNSTDYDKLNLNDLGNFLKQRKNIQTDVVKVGSFEAGLLFRLWKDSRTDTTDGEIDIPVVFSNDEIIRLKSLGLISGSEDKFKFTQRGKEVIKTMVLTEKNIFDKTSKDKSYEQKLSETKIAGGPRLALGKKK